MPVLAEETLLNAPEVDVVVRGEGDAILVELLHCLATPRSRGGR